MKHHNIVVNYGGKSENYRNEMKKEDNTLHIGSLH
jgi:hypothetical protein